MSFLRRVERPLIESRVVGLLHFITKTKESSKTTIPGQLPSTLSQSTLCTILENPYWCTEKSDGERVLFLVIKDSLQLNTKFPITEECYIVNRLGYCFPLPWETFGHLAGGSCSLFDGEVMKTKDGIPVLLLFDCFMHDGRHCGDWNFSKRLAIMREAVEKAEAALKSGDWTTFGTAMTEVKRLLDEGEVPDN